MLLAVLNGPDTFVSDGGTCLGSSMRMISSVILRSSVVDFVSPIRKDFKETDSGVYLKRSKS